MNKILFILISLELTTLFELIEKIRLMTSESNITGLHYCGPECDAETLDNQTALGAQQCR